MLYVFSMCVDIKLIINMYFFNYNSIFLMLDFPDYFLFTNNLYFIV